MRIFFPITALLLLNAWPAMSGQAGGAPEAAPPPQRPIVTEDGRVRYHAYPAPPQANDAEVMNTIESFLRSTLDDPDSYEAIDWSGLVLYEEEESKAYKWGMRHTYRVAHPQYRVLYVDRIFFIAYDGKVESVVEYNNQPCIDCKWW